MAERKPYLLRLHPALLDALQKWAAADLRSVNAQIEFLLRRAVREAGRMPRDPGSGPPDPDMPPAAQERGET